MLVNVNISTTSTKMDLSTTSPKMDLRSFEDAQKLASRLQEDKYMAFIDRADLGKKGVWFRVMIGPYDDHNVANKVAVTLKQKENLSGLVRRR